MKKSIKISGKKLFLNKEKITILNNYQASKIVGGAVPNVGIPITKVTLCTHG